MLLYLCPYREILSNSPSKTTDKASMAVVASSRHFLNCMHSWNERERKQYQKCL